MRLPITVMLAALLAAGTAFARDPDDEAFFDQCIKNSPDRMMVLPKKLRNIDSFIVWGALDIAARVCEDPLLTLETLLGKRVEQEFNFTEGVPEGSECEDAKTTLIGSLDQRMTSQFEQAGNEAFCAGS